MQHEGIKTEYKREFTDDFKYSVIAFANTDGGELYFGIADDGTVCGLENVDDVMLRVTNAMRDAIRPDVTLFTKCEPISAEGKTVVRLTVLRGTARPYYLAKKGIRTEGVYIRQGASSVPASEAKILQMIQESSGFVYEAERSLNQELTFTYCKPYFAARNIEFGETQKKSLGLIGTDGMFTNLAMLLSDQCPHIIKTAVFQGSSKTLFKDRREFSGSVLKQLDEAFAFLDLCNRTRAEIHGLERTDTRDYPGDAVREVLLNSLVHRDYSMQAPALISVFDDRMEFVSVGGLLPGISYEDILLGVSVARNKHLADVFYRLRLVEAYGTGILKINESYAEHSAKPKIEVSPHAFKVTLPNVNFLRENEQSRSLYNIHAAHSALHVSDVAPPPYAARQTAEQKAPANPAERTQILQELFQNQQFVSRKNVQDALGTSQANAVLILRQLLTEGSIEKLGKGRNICYRAKTNLHN